MEMEMEMELDFDFGFIGAPSNSIFVSDSPVPLGMKYWVTVESLSTPTISKQWKKEK